MSKLEELLWARLVLQPTRTLHTILAQKLQSSVPQLLFPLFLSYVQLQSKAGLPYNTTSVFIHAYVHACMLTATVLLH